MTDEPAANGLSRQQHTRLQRAIWDDRSRRLGMKVVVPPCPYSDTELDDMSRQGRTVAYLPHELSSHLTRDRWRRLFPDMDSYAEAPANGFANVADTWGWFDYETVRDAPLRGLDEPSAIAELADAGLTMLTLDQYIVASHDQLLLAGCLLDDRSSWTRLATTSDGRIIAARFDGAEADPSRPDEVPRPGALLVGYDIEPSDEGAMLGVRSRSASPPLRHQWTALRELTVDAYVRAGFPARLGVDADAYRRALPRIPEQPTEYAGRFDVPVVVEPRIPWREQAELLGVRLSSHARNFSFADVDPEGSPSAPYVGWFNSWRSRDPDPISSVAARTQLARDERGATPTELLAMDLALPDLAQTSRYFEAIGFVTTTPVTEDMSNRSPGRCLCMYRWRGDRELGANQHPLPYTMFRPLVRGRNVTVISRTGEAQ